MLVTSGSFKYELGQRVKLTPGSLADNQPVINDQETGWIIGRAEYTNISDQYLIRYIAGDGRTVEHWWAEDALVPYDE